MMLGWSQGVRAAAASAVCSTYWVGAPFQAVGTDGVGGGMGTIPKAEKPKLKTAWCVVTTRGRPGCENSVEGILMKESQSLVPEGAGRESAVLLAEGSAVHRPAVSRGKLAGVPEELGYLRAV